ncbi:hypothetical protein SG34_022695 [Thalassomonas viridans]|uniref:Uncharacterized protein n=1 Tax=Thalassomonas viridans TaxID=137584 RepID=A0AAF0C8R6_9GAMM|nr:hypothetical protein [Thalassomonas viridans]WDE04139.1 hypothetical protein SG34_022695 [Thalassomonas viridans]
MNKALFEPFAPTGLTSFLLTDLTSLRDGLALSHIKPAKSFNKPGTNNQVLSPDNNIRCPLARAHTNNPLTDQH